MIVLGATGCHEEALHLRRLARWAACGVGDSVTPPLEPGRGTSRQPAQLIGLPQHGATDPVSIDLHRKRAELDG